MNTFCPKCRQGLDLYEKNIWALARVITKNSVHGPDNCRNAFFASLFQRVLFTQLGALAAARPKWENEQLYHCKSHVIM